MAIKITAKYNEHGLMFCVAVALSPGFTRGVLALKAGIELLYLWSIFTLLYL